VIDDRLIEEVQRGHVVLFLGAGASLGAADRNGNKIPDTDGLKDLIATKFLSPGYDKADFKAVYDFACSNKSVREVQSYLHEILFGFDPAPFHLKIPNFVWAGLATTNYDLVIERAYKPGGLQNLSLFRRDADAANASLGANGVIYNKLHGCITTYQDVAPPLIASTEQIINHKEGRAGQFAQFLEWAKMRTIVFAGYALGDANMRTLFEEVRKDGDNRPRHYFVRPDIKKEEASYWQERRVQTIDCAFERFIDELDRRVPGPKRKLALVRPPFSETDFTKYISRKGVSESERLRVFLQSQCELVTENSVVVLEDPKKFYSGFDLNWYPFANNLDVARRATRAIMEERVVPFQADANAKLVVVKSHAGGGKSVALRRLAWDIAHTLKRLVFYMKHAADISLSYFEEIFSLTNVPVILVVDDLAEAAGSVEKLMLRARTRKWALLVIGGVRFNEWNIRCEELESLVDNEYEIGYLSLGEIDHLLAKLEEHGALGELLSLSLDQRKRRLQEQYGRQLLVALHEATRNSSFRQIVVDEFRNIVPQEAQVLYLDVCALNRFGPPVRAGLIARVHGISFEEFAERFFKPLDHLIDAKRDSRTGDWTYKARHPLIAEMVYTEVLVGMNERFDNLMRIVSKLNPSYSYDREVLMNLVRGSTLAEIFRDRVKGAAIYDAALEAVGRDAMVLHQQGIYEMRLGGDASSLDRAERLLREAGELAPDYPPIKHSLAELSFKRSLLSEDEVEKVAWRRQAETQASELLRRDHTSHPHHTLIKVAIESVRDLLDKAEKGDDEVVQEALSQAIKHAEDVLRNGLQRFPNDGYLLAAEGTLGEILQNADRALRALKKAFDANPQSELIARRYARTLKAKGRVSEAVEILRKGLDRNPGSRVLHFDMGQSLRLLKPNADIVDGPSLLYHFQRSFAPDDRNYEAQFWFARQLSLMGRGNEAKSYFAILKRLQIPFRQKFQARGGVMDADGKPAIYYGQISKRSSTFAFVRSDGDGLECYISLTGEQMPPDFLREGDRVRYQLEFTLGGPKASNVQIV